MNRELEIAMQKEIDRIYYKNLSMNSREERMSRAAFEKGVRWMYEMFYKPVEWKGEFLESGVVIGAAGEIITAPCLKEHPELYTGSWCHKCNQIVLSAIDGCPLKKES